MGEQDRTPDDEAAPARREGDAPESPPAAGPGGTFSAVLRDRLVHSPMSRLARLRGTR